MRSSARRSRGINLAPNDPLEDLWQVRPPEITPIGLPKRTATTGGGPSAGPSSDARSLEIQAQIEAESRRIAWQRTYGGSRSVPNVPAPASSVSPKPALPGSPVRGHTFTPIALYSAEIIQGVYAIVQTTTERIYVGSSNDIVRRLGNHVAALRAQRHHAAKLQEAWQAERGGGFRFFLIERVGGAIKTVRDREQYWINELRAFPQGFNSKSTADGPEPSLHTQIDAAIKERLMSIYIRLAPHKLNYKPEASDLSRYKEDMKSALRKKLKNTAIAFVLAVVASDPHSGLGVLWIGVVGYALFIVFDWPDSPKKRADARAESDHRNADMEARRNADALLISQLAVELSLPEEKIAAVYRDAPQIVRERNALRERFRTDPVLRFRAERNRRRSS